MFLELVGCSWLKSSKSADTFWEGMEHAIGGKKGQRWHLLVKVEEERGRGLTSSWLRQPREKGSIWEIRSAPSPQFWEIQLRAQCQAWLPGASVKRTLGAASVDTNTGSNFQLCDPEQIYSLVKRLSVKQKELQGNSSWFAGGWVTTQDVPIPLQHHLWALEIHPFSQLMRWGRGGYLKVSTSLTPAAEA